MSEKERRHEELRHDEKLHELSEHEMDNVSGGAALGEALRGRDALNAFSKEGKAAMSDKLSDDARFGKAATLRHSGRV